MGLFLHIAIIKERGIFPVKKYLSSIASDSNFNLDPTQCLIKTALGGTIVQLNQDCSSYDDVACELSKKADSIVLLCYIYDDDFWGYCLYDRGKKLDCFCPIPDYFGEIDEKERLFLAGNAEILAQAFHVPAQKLNRYLCCWAETKLEEKAYSDDRYGYNNVWQIIDFINALGFPFPLSDRPEEIKTEKKQEIKDKEPFHFQVNLGGMLDILSNHLYKSPDVFVRELLQNGIDAITLRQKEQPGWKDGRIIISVDPGHRIEFRDNGSGLTEEGIHRFLAVIGQSSKTQLIDGKIPEDYIGRFGIGLLSCFMVSDSIVVHTKPTDGSIAHVWTGLPDGTYTLTPLYQMTYHSGNSNKIDSTGTTVILTAKPGAEHYFQPEKIIELVQYYGLVLPVPIYLQGNSERLNNIPADFSIISRSQLLSFGEWLFHEEFLDAIPIQTPHLSGVAYILSYRTDSSVKVGHRIYLKQMLLTEDGNTLLPSWAFFLRCFLNTRNLRPTASREDFYEDMELNVARKEFENTVKSYLEQMAQNDPNLLSRIVNTHARAIKSMAVWDDTLFALFIDYLPFETSEGTFTGAMLKKVKGATWVHSVSRFKQLKPIFMAQGTLLICTGYTFDEELISKLTRLFALPFSPLQEDNIDFVLNELSPAEQYQMSSLIWAANEVLEEFDCQTDVRRFLPADLPVLYSMSEEVQFLRQVESARDISSNIFSDALTSLLESVEQRPLAMLYFNLNSPLIQRLATIQDESLLESVSQVLYVQALLAGGYPLRGKELKTMNRELLNLIEHST